MTYNHDNCFWKTRSGEKEHFKLDQQLIQNTEKNCNKKMIQLVRQRSVSIYLNDLRRSKELQVKVQPTQSIDLENL